MPKTKLMPEKRRRVPRLTERNSRKPRKRDAPGRSVRPPRRAQRPRWGLRGDANSGFVLSTGGAGGESRRALAPASGGATAGGRGVAEATLPNGTPEGSTAARGLPARCPLVRPSASAQPPSAYKYARAQRRRRASGDAAYFVAPVRAGSSSAGRRRRRGARGGPGSGRAGAPLILLRRRGRAPGACSALACGAEGGERGRREVNSRPAALPCPTRDASGSRSPADPPA